MNRTKQGGFFIIIIEDSRKLILCLGLGRIGGRIGSRCTRTDVCPTTGLDPPIADRASLSHVDLKWEKVSDG